MQKNPLTTAEFFIDIKQNDKAKIVLDLVKPYATGIFELDQIGKLYSDLREFNDSLEIALKIYALNTNKHMMYDLRTNIIRAYLALNKPDDALVYILINEREKPKDQANLMDKAMAFFLLNRKVEGEKILMDLLANPDTEDVKNRVNFNLGTYDLNHGRFKEGMRRVLLEGRKLNIWLNHKYPIGKQWQGEDAPGKTVVLCPEGGIGDEIISIRFMKHFRERGMHPIWLTDRKDLAEVYKRCGFETITDGRQMKDDWLWCYSMPTPVYLQLEPNDLWYGPYLKPLQQHKNLLPDTGKKRIGIKCMGNPKFDQDLNRSVPLNEMVDSIPEEYEIYSFHVDEDINHPRVIPLKDKLKSWDDTLDYIDQMDVIVSSCTSLIHAAGAMGKESYVIVPILTYYTWAAPGEKSAWYGDNLTALKQQVHNSWKEPLDELKKRL